PSSSQTSGSMTCLTTATARTPAVEAVAAVERAWKPVESSSCPILTLASPMQTF
ncbi:hypothetical protein M9458_007120, partial [Cirrhinus mrigala]